MDSIRPPALWSGGRLFVLNQWREMCLWGLGHGWRWRLEWVYCWWRSSLWFFFILLMWSPPVPFPLPSLHPLHHLRWNVHHPEGPTPAWASARSGGGSVHWWRAAGPIAVRRLSRSSLREISIWTQLRGIDQPSLLAFRSTVPKSQRYSPSRCLRSYTSLWICCVIFFLLIIYTIAQV